MKRTVYTLVFKYLFLITGFFLGLVSLQAQTMQIGTNFWGRVDWTGEIPFKSDANFSRAWNSGISNYVVNENVWNDEFRKEIDFYTVLRFMDWLPTNKSPITSWSQRRFPNDALFDYAKSNTTGINMQKNSENEIWVYPNPFDAELTIKSGTNAISEISLITETGNKLLSRKPMLHHNVLCFPQRSLL